MARLHHRILRKLHLGAVAYRILSAWYGLSFWFHERANGPPIIVFQMGKVGSSTIVETLRATSAIRNPIYHVHRLSDDGLAFIATKDRIRKRAYPGAHYWQAQVLRRRLSRKEAPGKWRLIALTREPVARNVSALFHALDVWYPTIQEDLVRVGRQHVLEQLRTRLITNFPSSIATAWFDAELKASFGLDVYTQPFDTGRGFQIYDQGSIRLLVVRIDNLDERLQEALQAFLELDAPFDLISANTAESKSYADLYAEFKQEVALPAAYVDSLLTSQYAQHFYTPEELHAFRSKWVDKDCRE